MPDRQPAGAEPGAALRGTIAYPDGGTIFFNQKATTDPAGRFAFRNVVPAPICRVRRDKDEERGVWSLGEPVQVEPQPP